MKLPHKTLEKKLFIGGYNHIIAVDEVGMGCLAGPVVVCAALFTPEFYKKHNQNLSWLRDSKLLNPSQREIFANRLRQNKNFKFQIAYCHPTMIDKINIYQAARRAMRRAITKLYVKGHPPQCAGCPLTAKTMILVDGPHQIAGLDLPQQAIIKGDRKVFTIACASIIAKVFRDKMMTRYAKKFPGYGFEIHKGYATKLHRAQLASLGPSSLHRRSFKL